MSAVDQLMIEELASSEAELRDRVESLEADVDIYRAILQSSLQCLHQANIDRDRSQSRILALVGELRLAHAETRALAGHLRAQQEQAA